MLIDRLSDTRERRKPAQYIACMEISTANNRLAVTQAAFTLYELMITLIIVGVVLSYGMANLSDFTKNGRMTALLRPRHRLRSCRLAARVKHCPGDTEVRHDPSISRFFSARFFAV